MHFMVTCSKCGSGIEGYNIGYCENEDCDRYGVVIAIRAFQGKAYKSNLKGTFISFAEPEHPAKILSIHEVAIKTGLSPDQIRYYARNGHIKPRRKGKWGHFQFHQKDVDILNKLVAKRHTKEGGK